VSQDRQAISFGARLGLSFHFSICCEAFSKLLQLPELQIVHMLRGEGGAADDGGGNS
jgi:hypothetical protein